MVAVNHEYAPLNQYERFVALDELARDELRIAGDAIHRLVNASRDQLDARNMNATLLRYGTSAFSAVNAVQEDVKTKGEQKYLVYDDYGNLAAFAGLSSNVHLRRRTLLSSERRLGPLYEYANPYLYAWGTMQAAENGLLRESYAFLVQTALSAGETVEGPKPYTIESRSAPKIFHESISNNEGLIRVKNKPWVVEAGGMVLRGSGVSTLYARPQQDWTHIDWPVPRHGILMELKDNTQNLTTMRKHVDEMSLDDNS